MVQTFIETRIGIYSSDGDGCARKEEKGKTEAAVCAWTASSTARQLRDYEAKKNNIYPLGGY